MAFYSRDGFSCSCNIKEKCDGCNIKYIMPTKGDQIRSMTDEELARTLYDVSWAAWRSINGEGIWTEQDWLDWLKQEAE